MDKLLKLFEKLIYISGITLIISLIISLIIKDLFIFTCIMGLFSLFSVLYIICKFINSNRDNELIDYTYKQSNVHMNNSKAKKGLKNKLINGSLSITYFLSIPMCVIGIITIILLIIQMLINVT